MSSITVFKAKINPRGRLLHRSGLIPKYLDFGTYICKLNLCNQPLFAEINPYHDEISVKKIISDLTDLAYDLQNLIEENNIADMEVLIGSSDLNTKSVISQLFFSGISLVHHRNITDLYVEYFDLKDELSDLRFYASGGTLLEFTDISSLEHEIIRSQNQGLQQFKFRPPVGFQLSHEDRLKTPPKVDIETLEAITAGLSCHFNGVMVDLGCRLTQTDLVAYNYLLSKYDFIEEPIKRHETFNFTHCNDLKVSGGEFCRDYNELKVFLHRHKGLSYFQPDSNLISAYDIKKFTQNFKSLRVSMHNWTTPISAIHNIAIGSAIHAEYIEWPVVDNPFYDVKIFSNNINSYSIDVGILAAQFEENLLHSSSLSIEKWSV